MSNQQPRLLMNWNDAEEARRFLRADETHVVSIVLRGGSPPIDVVEMGEFRIDRATAKLAGGGTIFFDPAEVVAFSFEDAGPEVTAEMAVALREGIDEIDALEIELFKVARDSKDKTVRDVADRLNAAVERFEAVSRGTETEADAPDAEPAR